MDIESRIKKGQPLKDLNTFKVGGEAEYYFEASVKEDLAGIFAWASEQGIKSYLLGGGSNILVPDQGIRGLVVRLANNERKVMGERIECGAGTTLSQANTLAMANGLSGLEWSVGIPRATVGGSIRGNAGAFWVDMSKITENVEVFRISSGKFELLSNRMCKFSYRNSIFKEKSDYIIWKAILKLSRRDADEIQKKVEEVLDFRLKRYPNLPSAGSVFENFTPQYVEECNKELYGELKGKIGKDGQISAGLIIDRCGLKGKTIGGIKISLEHANHIVNTGNGTAEEIVMMISFIKQQVRDKFALELKEEITYFGF